jgi:hypothetical protein
VEKKNIPKDADNKSADIARKDIDAIITDILSCKKQRGEAAYKIGKRLNEAKIKLVEHGEWLDFLGKVKMHERQAQRYMQLANEYSNTTAVSDLGMSKALLLLALPKAERNVFIKQEHFVGNIKKRVCDMSNREMLSVLQRNKAEQDKKAVSENPVNKSEQKTNWHNKSDTPNEILVMTETTVDTEREEKPAVKSPKEFRVDFSLVSSSIEGMLNFIGSVEHEQDDRKDAYKELRNLCEETLKKLEVLTFEKS